MMVNFLETLYVVTGLCLLIALVAWVQSRSGGERAVRYGRRMRRALLVALISGATAVVLYTALS
jgi:hypothetical protein